MVRDYVESFYLPCARRETLARGTRLRTSTRALPRPSNGCSPHGLRSASPSSPSPSLRAAPSTPRSRRTSVPWNLSDVTVQLWVAPTRSEPYPIDTQFEGRRGPRRPLLACRFPHEAGIDAVLVARVLPCHPSLADPYVPGLITWSD